MTAPVRPPKVPVSVLVVICTEALDALLIERADTAGFWQSVTGSLDDPAEDRAAAARREVAEETGITHGVLHDWRHAVAYDIYPHYRWRYAPGVTRNTEHWFALVLPERVPAVLNPREHVAQQWLPWHEAAARCRSESNAEALRELPRRLAARAAPAALR
jgi:dATP pyrophosphohydrolase